MTKSLFLIIIASEIAKRNLVRRSL